MAKHSVTIERIEKVVSQLRDVGANVPQIVDNALQESAQQLRAKVVENINIQNAVDTGELKGSIYADKLGMCEWAITARAPHAVFVEYGTGNLGDPEVAHTTRPSWVYFNKNLGEYRTAHPMPARPFMRTSFMQMKDVITQNTRKALISAYIREATK